MHMKILVNNMILRLLAGFLFEVMGIRPKSNCAEFRLHLCQPKFSDVRLRPPFNSKRALVRFYVCMEPLVLDMPSAHWTRRDHVTLKYSCHTTLYNSGCPVQIGAVVLLWWIYAPILFCLPNQWILYIYLHLIHLT